MPYGRKRSRSAVVYSRATKRRRLSRTVATAKARGVLRRYTRRWRARKQIRSLVPRRMGFAQPPRIMVKMQNVLTDSALVAVGSWQVNTHQFLPLRLRDPEITVQNQQYAANFLDYSRMYSTYRVHGFKVKVQILDWNNNGNDGFYSCFYTYPGPTDQATPGDPYTLTSAMDVNGFLQERGIRRKFLIGTGAQKATTLWHDAGYWSIKKIQGERNLDPNEYEGTVDASGGVDADPLRKPILHHKMVTANTAGFRDAITPQVRYFITFYVEWYGRRRAIEGVRSEV